MSAPRVLDPASGSRMFYFDRADERVLFGDIRSEQQRLSSDTWRDDLTAGFAECFRVLAPNGVLIFKWAEVQIPIGQILALTPARPLVGHRSGKRSGTHWITFLKEDES